MIDSENLLPLDGEAYFLKNFLDADRSNELMRVLESSLNWKEEKVRIFGKWIMQPRKVAWYGDPGTDYTYSGLKHSPDVWTKELLSLKSMVEEKLSESFNSVLANLYRNERDSNGWHSDNEKELGENPVIASLSFGETREFLMRHKQKDFKLKIPLETGSLLVMKGGTQAFWKHTLPKRTRRLGPRINLTFRKIIY